MKKAVMKKMMAGLCTAAMLVSCTMGVLAADIELDPSEETRQRGDTEVIANVTDNDNKPDYLITIPQSVDFGTLQQPTTDADAYSSVDITVKCIKAEGLAAGQGIAVLVKDETAESMNDPFKLLGENSDCSLTYEMYDQNSNVQDGTWYQNGFLFITFTGAVQESVEIKLQPVIWQRSGCLGWRIFRNFELLYKNCKRESTVEKNISLQREI